MLLGPIFQVEMVAIARRRRYMLLRVVYGTLMLLILFSSYSTASLYARATQSQISIRAAQQLATTFFQSFNWLQMLAILAVGPAMVVGTIASERERRTIEYLFASDLSNQEIVLGKIIARLSLIGQFVLVGLPILFIFRLFGGISTNLLLSSYSLVASTALMLTALSICVSVWSPTTRDATTRVYGLLAMFLFIPWVLEFLGRTLFKDNSFWVTLITPVVNVLSKLNPLNFLIFSMRLQVDNTQLIETIGLQLLVSASAIAIATVFVRRVHLRESSRGKKMVSRLKRDSSKAVGNSPMIWKEVYSRSSSTKLGLIGRIAILILLLAVFLPLLYFVYEAYTYRGSGSFIRTIATGIGMLSIFIGCGMLILVAALAAGSVTTEKEHDCWLALLATPLTGREILWGKICGCLYAMRWPMTLFMFAWGLTILAVPTAIGGAVAIFATMLFSAWFAVNLGILFSLRSLTTMRAIGAAIATLFFVGGGYMFCCCPVISSTSGSEDSWTLILAPCIPFLLGFPATELVRDTWDPGQHEIPIYTAYVLGTIGYFIAGMLIYMAQVNNFDEFTGRSCSKPEGLKTG